MDATAIKKQIQGTFLFESVEGKDLDGKTLPEREMDAIKNDLCIGRSSITFFRDDVFIIKTPEGCKAQSENKGKYSIENGVITLTYAKDACETCGNKINLRYYYVDGQSKISPLDGDEDKTIIITLK